MTDVNMLNPRVLYWIFWNINGTSIITIHSYFTQYNAIVCKHLFHPEKLCATTSQSNVFSLYSEKGDRVLLLAMLWHQIVSKVETSSLLLFLSSAMHAQSLSLKLARFTLVSREYQRPKTKVKSTTDMMDYSFNNSNVGLFWIYLISYTSTNIIAYVRMTSCKI